MLTEARELGEELGNTEIRAEAMSWRVPTFVALVRPRRPPGARSPPCARRPSTRRSRSCIHVAEHYGSAIALCDGRLDEAEAMARRSHEWSRLLTGRDASGVYGIQMFSIRREQGRLAELAPVIRILAGERARGPWRPGLVAAARRAGHGGGGAGASSRGSPPKGSTRFRESLWLASLTYLTDACAALGDEAMAALVYPELEPLAGANVMIGHLVACYGAADRYLGMLAATLGEWERAEAHFERAMELNRRMGAATWLAHTAYEYARLLLGRGSSATATGRGRCSARPRRWPSGSGCGACSAGSARSAPPTPRADASPTGSRRARSQILGLVARGLSNREIGATLFISEHTAANHIRSILRKTGCANRTEAASYAHRHGLVEA